MNTFSVENILSINDFTNYKEKIEVTADIEEFKCKSTIDYYSSNNWYFKANGIDFSAKSRTIKERNKLLSKSFDSHSYFKIIGQYKDNQGNDKREIDSRDKKFNNSYIDGEGLNIFYFDKNRNRQITTGNYKTTFERILDDLSWRFIKKIDEGKEKELIKNISGEYFKTVNEITDSNAGSITAEEVSVFFDNKQYKNLKIDLLNFLAPYKNAFFAIREENEIKQIVTKDLGSGIETILTLLLLKNIAGSSRGKIIYLIDEPELHLHPLAQEKLLDLLLEESKDKQIFISTHSPYMFKGSVGSGANLLIFKRNEDNEIEISNSTDGDWGLFGRFSPTWGEINWFAYNLPTVEFHNELYGFLQSKAIDEDTKNGYEQHFDNWLTSKDIEQSKNWIKELKGVEQPPVDRTIQTYIRNSIHHPENNRNDDYNKDELKKSIEKMIEIS